MEMDAPTTIKTGANSSTKKVKEKVKPKPHQTKNVNVVKTVFSSLKEHVSTIMKKKEHKK